MAWYGMKEGPGGFHSFILLFVYSIFYNIRCLALDLLTPPPCRVGVGVACIYCIHCIVLYYMYVRIKSPPGEEGLD